MLFGDDLVHPLPLDGVRVHPKALRQGVVDRADPVLGRVDGHRREVARLEQVQRFTGVDRPVGPSSFRGHGDSIPLDSLPSRVAPSRKQGLVYTSFPSLIS